MIFLAPFFWGVPWLPTSLARSSRLIGSVGKGGSCAGLLCGSLATRLRIPPVVPVWLQGWSSCSVQSTGALVRFPTAAQQLGCHLGQVLLVPESSFQISQCFVEKTCRHYFPTDLDDSHLSPAWCLKMEYFFMQEFVKMIRCEDVKMWTYEDV